jgi:hypothetical protein
MGILNVDQACTGLMVAIAINAGLQWFSNEIQLGKIIIILMPVTTGEGWNLGFSLLLSGLLAALDFL